jgi:hypothetical protein
MTSFLILSLLYVFFFKLYSYVCEHFSLGDAKATALHHYSKSFRGFSAMITPEQANKLAGTVF